jgi:pimeloyl-ACP methyl ester carboxylesterase
MPYYASLEKRYMVSKSKSAPSVVSPDKEHTQLKMPHEHWWRHLAHDFPEHKAHFSLKLKERLKIGASTVTDLGLRAGIIAATSALSFPMSIRPDIIMRDRKERQFYCDLADAGDASQFFIKPNDDIRVRIRKSSRLAHQPKDGQSFLLSFKSPFQAVNPKLRDDYAKHHKNNIAWAQYWRHDDKPRATICLIHGFVLDSYWVNSKFFALEWFYNQGYDVLLYTLPFHGYRQGLLSPFSGHGYFSHGPLHINEVHAHAVHDFRVFLNWLFKQGTPKAGVTGLSMGGYATALLACTDERLAFSIPIVPPASLVDMVFEWPILGHLIKSSLKTINIPIQEARHTLAVNSPLTWKPLLPKEHLMIIAALDDRITFAKHSKLLWEHWQRPAIHWFAGGHILHWGKSDYLKAIRKFLDNIDFKP